MRNRFWPLLISVVLIATALPSISSAASPELKPCSTAYSRFIGRLTNEQPVEYFDDNVAIIWFPKTNNTYTTTNIEVDNVVWGTERRFSKKGSVEVLNRRERIDKIGHFRFGLRVSEKELTELRRTLESGRHHGATCVGGACEALKAAGIRQFTFPANLTPTGNAIYSAVNRIVPGARVINVEYLGQNALQSVFKSKDFWTENLTAGAFAAMFAVPVTTITLIAVEVVHYNGTFERVIVPVTQKKPEKKIIQNRQIEPRTSK